jgi:serine palmitoyltransferase
MSPPPALYIAGAHWHWRVAGALGAAALVFAAAPPLASAAVCLVVVGVGVASLRAHAEPAPAEMKKAPAPAFVRRTAAEALAHYGCGACGPRGFFGTFDVHVALEAALARAHASEAALVYSCDYLALLSILGSFGLSNRSTVYFDQRCPRALRDGALLYRAAAVDVDIEGNAELAADAIVCATAQTPVPVLRRLALCVRALIVVAERDAVTLAAPNCVRVGALGALGGGYASGARAIVERQRLGGVGYCFSAALPPFVAAAALCEMKA